MVDIYTPEHLGWGKGQAEMVRPDDSTEDDMLYVQYDDYKAAKMPAGLSVTLNGADVWLHFDAGLKKGSMNLSEITGFTPIVQEAIRTWAKRFKDTSPTTRASGGADGA